MSKAAAAVQRSCEMCGGPVERGPRALVCSDACCKAKKSAYDRAYASSRPRVAVPKVKTKHCPGCDQRLPAHAFHRNRSAPSGLNGYCRECRRVQVSHPAAAAKERARKERWYSRHRETMRRPGESPLVGRAPPA